MRCSSPSPDPIPRCSRSALRPPSQGGSSRLRRVPVRIPVPPWIPAPVPVTASCSGDRVNGHRRCRCRRHGPPARFRFDGAGSPTRFRCRRDGSSIPVPVSAGEFPGPGPVSVGRLVDPRRRTRAPGERRPHAVNRYTVQCGGCRGGGRIPPTAEPPRREKREKHLGGRVATPEASRERKMRCGPASGTGTVWPTRATRREEPTVLPVMIFRGRGTAVTPHPGVRLATATGVRRSGTGTEPVRRPRPR